MNYDNSKYVDTSCKDCGKQFWHCAPQGAEGLFKNVYEDPLFDIHYLFWAKHFLITWKDSPEKVFFTCHQTEEELKHEQGRMKLVGWLADNKVNGDSVIG